MHSTKNTNNTISEGRRGVAHSGVSSAAAWAERDLQHLWHPCSQMKDYESFPPLMVRSAQGSYIELMTGERLIDATSSWWCKLLGHGHPRLRAALFAQAERFEHVMLAHVGHPAVVSLSERLAALTPGLNKVAYASDGACAVEMAMKMSLQAHQIAGHSQRTQWMALAGSYHGETCAALAVSDLAIYRKPYESLLNDNVHFLQSVPYVSGPSDPLWHDSAASWAKAEQQLEQHADHLAAVLVEPVVQAANGMLIYSADFLARLRRWTAKRGIHLIADEIMTALGRTGTWLACEHAGIEPDFLCLGKGLTGGWLPLSAVLTSDALYDLFYEEYELGKSFLHSHTYAGNALAAAVALACLDCIEQEGVLKQVNQQAKRMNSLMTQVAEATGCLRSVRQIGAVTAADLIPRHPQDRLGFRVFQEAARRGALLRPLGNSLYWAPPLNTSISTLEALRDITVEAIRASVNKT